MTRSGVKGSVVGLAVLGAVPSVSWAGELPLPGSVA
jgi:hypothetical protein